MVIGSAARNRLAEDKLEEGQETLDAKNSAHFDY
jgi:hypothetical protein